MRSTTAVLEMMTGIESLIRSKREGMSYEHAWNTLRDFLHSDPDEMVNGKTYQEFLLSHTAASLSLLIGCSRSHAHRVQVGTNLSVPIAERIQAASGFSLEEILKRNGSD